MSAEAVNRNRRERFEVMCDQALASITAEGAPKTGSLLSAAQLETAAQHVCELRAVVRAGNLPAREHRQTPHSRIRMDSWPLGGELGNRLTALESFYQQM